MSYVEFLLLIILFQVEAQCDYGFSDGSNNLLKLPPNFMFGAGSSAPQVEGAWNVDGKGESEWDYYWHNHVDDIIDNSSSDIACDSYHLWEEDVDALTQIGFNAYRFSLSWSRLLPTGKPNNINKNAVQHYNSLIDKLLDNNITPVVTLFHFDMPLNISKMGGWSNELSVNYFLDYAVFAFKTFGRKVKNWVTINEPGSECTYGYGTANVPPGVNVSGIANYLCGHYILLAHAAAYHAYHALSHNISDGKVGISLGFDYFYPKDNQSLSDRLAAQIGIDFTFGWMANPIIGTGDYPVSMRARVNELSLQEGRLRSRLPYFTEDEVFFIKGTADFIGINHYTSLLATFAGPGFNGTEFSNIDSNVVTSVDPSWNTTAMPEFRFVPSGFGAALRYIRDRYNNPHILVTENGYAGYANESLQCNLDRELWFKEYITEMLKTIQEGCNVQGYFAWSLLDDFEWNDGYTIKFGITKVDFSNVNRTRRVKGVGLLFHNIQKYGLPVQN